MFSSLKFIFGLTKPIGLWYGFVSTIVVQRLSTKNWASRCTYLVRSCEQVFYVICLVIRMNLADMPLEVLRKVFEHFGWQLVMLPANFVIVDVWACLVFYYPSMSESEIVVPLTCWENCKETICQTLSAVFQFGWFRVVVIVRELSRCWRAILSILYLQVIFF